MLVNRVLDVVQSTWKRGSRLKVVLNIIVMFAVPSSLTVKVRLLVTIMFLGACCLTSFVTEGQMQNVFRGAG